MNSLKNYDFKGGTYQPSGQVSLVLPNNWEAGWLDNVKGPRGTEAKCLKPEILVITAVQPYLNPPRTEPPDNSVTGFKLYGTICYWLLQQVVSTPGKEYSLNARAHAWSRMSEDPNDAHYSHGIGTGAFYAPEGAAGLNDGQRNYRFRLGIDPFGGKDPFGSAVIWGVGAHIYNTFSAVPEVKASARADKITVFMFVDCLYGMVNSNSFLSRPVLEETGVAPSTGRGKPREDYERTFWVMPQDTTHERALQIFEQAFPLKGTLGFSYDDAGIGDLNKRTAVLWDLKLSQQQEFRDWYTQWYPGVIVEFRDPKVG